MKTTWPKLNQVILVIIMAYFVLTAAAGFLPPFFAIFVTTQVAGAGVASVGIAITVYWATKSVIQLFVARFIDKNHGEIDDFYFMIIGGFLNAAFISLYYFATGIAHVYLLQFLLGMADAMVIPPFYAIFTRHIDKGKEGFEWSLFSSFSVGAGSALGGVLGGVLGTVVGFRAVFPIVGILTGIATIMLVFLKPYILPKVRPGGARIFIEK
ncbi:MAG: MFS transporter [Candidatus Sungbacteria bacterium]|uniref:MFS transporter n=1 Tax=Candidatus Sungiibacteriota bacterium TaxID=2750080 RepID=A0A932QY37_9BACT|nr:MFS transporter [Candidatus Sungbacteria bacterium]